MILFDLPESIQRQVAEFLLGADLFQLSHASCYALQAFSQDHFWRPRLPASFVSTPVHARPRRWFGLLVQCSRHSRSDDRSAKWEYMHQQSLLFPGSTTDGKPCYELKWRQFAVVRTGGVYYVPLTWDNREALRGALTYDTWFSLAPKQDGCVQGGILFGGQSSALGRGLPHCHRQSAIIDTQGTLYCSVIYAHKKPIASNLLSERWYHLALVWGNGSQRVYLDGELVSQEEGSLHREWIQLTHWQVGAGCISGQSVAKPTAEWNGWLGFRGVIDEFRVWNRALSHADPTFISPRGSWRRFCASLLDEEGSYASKTSPASVL